MKNFKIKKSLKMEFVTIHFDRDSFYDCKTGLVYINKNGYFYTKNDKYHPFISPYEFKDVIPSPDGNYCIIKSTISGVYYDCLFELDKKNNKLVYMFNDWRNVLEWDYTSPNTIAIKRNEQKGSDTITIKSLSPEKVLYSFKVPDCDPLGLHLDIDRFTMYNSKYIYTWNLETMVSNYDVEFWDDENRCISKIKYIQDYLVVEFKRASVTIQDDNWGITPTYILSKSLQKLYKFKCAFVCSIIPNYNLFKVQNEGRYHYFYLPIDKLRKIICRAPSFMTEELFDSTLLGDIWNYSYGYEIEIK